MYVCLSVLTTPEALNGFSSRLILESFAKIYQHTLILVKSLITIIETLEIYMLFWHESDWVGNPQTDRPYVTTYRVLCDDVRVGPMTLEVGLKNLGIGPVT
jgi:hypothetical protein